MKRFFLCAAAVVWALSCSGTGPTEMKPPGPESCDNGKDDNGDGKTDCADPKCFSSPKCKVAVERCDNGVDDDNNGAIDCLDPSCQNGDCGPGCSCNNMARTESDCGDRFDNDSDTLIDCQDLDCAQVPPCGGFGGGSGTGGGTGTAGGSATGGGAGTAGGTATGGGAASGGGTATGGGTAGSSGGAGGTAGGGSAGSGTGGGTAGGASGGEICSDGIDNDGDRAIDCADSNCVGNAACTALSDGKGCLNGSQCASGHCLTEAAVGYPNGYCTNPDSAPCTVGPQNQGCHGGTCLAGAPNRCRLSCVGNGLVGPNRCRPGYACEDHDTNSSTPNLCLPLCTSDSECAGTGVGYGCNPMTKFCEQKNHPGGDYGAPCASDTDCKSLWCLLAPRQPGGYCVGACRGDTNNCAPGGYCQWNSSEGDNVGLCTKACTPQGTICRVETNTDYRCFRDGYGAQMGLFCSCAFAGQVCLTGRDCCRGVCTGALTDGMGNKLCDL